MAETRIVEEQFRPEMIGKIVEITLKPLDPEAGSISYGGVLKLYQVQDDGNIFVLSDSTHALSAPHDTFAIQIIVLD